MSHPIPSLKTLAAETASRLPSNVQLPQELIEYVYNYVDLKIVLSEIPAIVDDLQVLGARMASVTPQDYNAGLRDDLISEARRLDGLTDNVIALLNGAFAAVEQETDADWKAYYSERLTGAVDEVNDLKGHITYVIAQLTPLPDSDDDDL